MEQPTTWIQDSDQPKKQIGEVFNEMAPEYTRVMETMIPRYRNMLTTMVSSLPETRNIRSVLDLGCGNGNLTAVIRNHFPDASLHLVDASADMLEACRSRFGSKGIRFEQAMFQELEFAPDSYDFVAAGFSLHHLQRDEKPATIANIYRALKNQGVLAVTDLFIDTASKNSHSEFLGEWKTFMSGNGRTEEDWEWLMDHYTKYDRPEPRELYEQWFADAGFEKVSAPYENGPWLCLYAWK